jgi:hypothetical protein
MNAMRDEEIQDVHDNLFWETEPGAPEHLSVFLEDPVTDDCLKGTLIEKVDHSCADCLALTARISARTSSSVMPRSWAIARASFTATAKRCLALSISRRNFRKR